MSLIGLQAGVMSSIGPDALLRITSLMRGNTLQSLGECAYCLVLREPWRAGI